MATILPFQRFVFGAAEVNALQAAMSGHAFPGGWRGWEGPPEGESECDALEVTNPNDWEPLTLLRSRPSGRYLAKDADGFIVAESDTFRGLLAEIDIVPS